MEKAKISVIQLFAMLLIFNMGTSQVVGYGIDTKKDAWMAILLGMCGGMFLFTTLCFVNIQICHLQDMLERYLVNTWGGS